MARRKRREDRDLRQVLEPLAAIDAQREGMADTLVLERLELRVEGHHHLGQPRALEELDLVAHLLLEVLALRRRYGPPFGHDLTAGERRDDVIDPVGDGRSEEQTSELQSLMRISSAVLCL